MNAIAQSSPAHQILVGAEHTVREIAQQPALWSALAEMMDARQTRIDTFLGDWLRTPLNRVIFTGAGSSGFIAEMVADHLNGQWPADLRAVHSTSLLSHPETYLKPDRPTLLVSFARSGSSPESVAAVDLVRARVAQARFIDITCNAEGELARRGQNRIDTFTQLMPPASCDRGFAMTSSLSCMLLAALCMFDAAPWSQRLARLRSIASLGREALSRWEDDITALAQANYTRVIHLGSGPLEAWSREASLKLLELTAGRVAAFAHTPLGFRHGPKSLLDRNTLVVMVRSTQPVSRRYEQDLLDELRRDGLSGAVLSLGPQFENETDTLSLAVPPMPDAWLAPVWLSFAQRHALRRSAALGLTPDNPFPDGSVNRVVQGVTIHHSN